MSWRGREKRDFRWNYGLLPARRPIYISILRGDHSASAYGWFGSVERRGNEVGQLRGYTGKSGRSERVWCYVVVVKHFEARRGEKESNGTRRKATIIWWRDDWLSVLKPSTGARREGGEKGIKKRYRVSRRGQRNRGNRKTANEREISTTTTAVSTWLLIERQRRNRHSPQRGTA